MRVYGGRDPLTKQRHVLTEVIPKGPSAQRDAERARDRLLVQVAERRNPKTSATLDQLLERYLDQFQGSPNTLQLYRTHVKNHIKPLLGPVKIGRLDAEVLDSFYAELRRCRKHCARKRGLIDHRTEREHECDERCRPHRCKPLSATTIRHIHFILSGYVLGLLYTGSKIQYVIRSALGPVSVEPRCAGPFSSLVCTLSVGLPALSVLVIVIGLSIPTVGRRLQPGGITLAGPAQSRFAIGLRMTR